MYYRGYKLYYSNTFVIIIFLIVKTSMSLLMAFNKFELIFINPNNYFNFSFYYFALSMKNKNNNSICKDNGNASRKTFKKTHVGWYCRLLVYAF